MKVKRKKLKKIILALAVIAMSKAFATNDNLASAPVSAAVNPANIGWDLEYQIYAPTNKQGNFQLLPSTSTPTTPIAPPVTPAAFVLKKVKFKFVGAQVPIPPEVTAVYAKALNKPTDLDGLLALAEEMQTTYRDLGYILVRVIVPPQKIDPKKGVVTFEVIEGQIQKVIFTGDNPRAAKNQLLRYAEAIEAENPITYKTLDRFLNLANNLPGISVQATLVPDKTVLGASDLMINVTELNQSAFLSFNNHQTPYIGPGQALVGGAIYDIFGADSLSVSGAKSTNVFKELGYITGSYDLVTGLYATEINPVFSATQTRPGGALAVLDMLGNSTKYTLNVNQPLLVSSTQNVTFNSSLYHLNSNNRIFNGNPTLGFQAYNDDITALTAGATYKGIFWGTQNNMDAYTTIGLPILGTPANLNNPSRVNGRTKFILFDFDTSSIHYLTQKISFNLATTGQITPNPLLTEEQLGYGGMTYGQAYTPYIISGDNGFMGSLALRYDITPMGIFNLLQPEVFYDAGMVANNAALTGTISGASGQSAGLGFNMILFKTWQVNMTLAKPLRLTQVTNITTNGWEAFVNVVAVF